MLNLKPKQKIWIRVAIYVPLILFFGWRAFQAHQARKAAAEAQVQPAKPLEAPQLEGTQREIQLPNGQTVIVTEMTEEQARAQGFSVPEDDEAKPAPAEPEPSEPTEPEPAADATSSTTD